jgi:hypothetical protein
MNIRRRHTTSLSGKNNNTQGSMDRGSRCSAEDVRRRPVQCLNIVWAVSSSYQPGQCPAACPSSAGSSAGRMIDVYRDQLAMVAQQPPPSACRAQCCSRPRSCTMRSCLRFILNPTRYRMRSSKAACKSWVAWKIAIISSQHIDAGTGPGCDAHLQALRRQAYA